MERTSIVYEKHIGIVKFNAMQKPITTKYDNKELYRLTVETEEGTKFFTSLYKPKGASYVFNGDKVQVTLKTWQVNGKKRTCMTYIKVLEYANNNKGDLNKVTDNECEELPFE